MNPTAFKQVLMNRVVETLTSAEIDGERNFELHRLGKLEAQLRVKPRNGGAPRYFVVRVSEQL